MSENKKLNEQIAQDFYNNFKGKLEDEQLDQVVQEIKCTENKYHTQGSLICAVFYFRVTVGGYGDVKKQFTGNGGGGGLPGAQALIGDLYTSDLERLYFMAHEHFQIYCNDLFRNCIIRKRYNNSKNASPTNDVYTWRNIRLLCGMVI